MQGAINLFSSSLTIESADEILLTFSQNVLTTEN